MVCEGLGHLPASLTFHQKLHCASHKVVIFSDEFNWVQVHKVDGQFDFSFVKELEKQLAGRGVKKFVEIVVEALSRHPFILSFLRPLGRHNCFVHQGFEALFVEEPCRLRFHVLLVKKGQKCSLPPPSSCPTEERAPKKFPIPGSLFPTSESTRRTALETA